jgi:hypothetical protein
MLMNNYTALFSAFEDGTKKFAHPCAPAFIKQRTYKERNAHKHEQQQRFPKAYGEQKRRENYREKHAYYAPLVLVPEFKEVHVALLICSLAAESAR